MTSIISNIIANEAAQNSIIAETIAKAYVQDNFGREYKMIDIEDQHETELKAILVFDVDSTYEYASEAAAEEGNEIDVEELDDQTDFANAGFPIFLSLKIEIIRNGRIASEEIGLGFGYSVAEVIQGAGVEIEEGIAAAIAAAANPRRLTQAQELAAMFGARIAA